LTSMTRLTFVLLSGFLLRVALFYFGFEESAMQTYEIVTPWSSYIRGPVTLLNLCSDNFVVKEGLIYLSIGLSPSSGSSYHSPPLILALFHFLDSLPQFWLGCIFSCTAIQYFDC